MTDQTAEGAAEVESGAEVCPHFPECGGCTAQDVPYEEQLSRKQLALEDLFKPMWQKAVPVAPSPSIWNYRNRIDLTFGRKHYEEPPPKDFVRETVLGFKREGKWYWTIDITECRIGPVGVENLINAVRAWVRERSLTAYSSKSKDGFLRVLLVREGKRTGERMVVLVTNEGELDAASFVETVQSAWPSTSIQHAIFRGKAEVSAADEIRVLHGKAYITDELLVPNGAGYRKIVLRVSPFGFSQTNSAATEVLYGTIRQWVKESRPRFVYDLYGGSGGIAFSVSDKVDRVVSVESVETASIDGTFNREANDADNVAFFTQSVEEYLRDAISMQHGLLPQSMVVLDPPRAGLHPKAIKRLLLLKPQEIVYVSCKPSVFAKELPLLLPSYDLVDMRAVDLFPHTEHVELLARLHAKE
ncbi:MAG: 23S rRNA (uracil(1939)-C(5))-methyltransferase RlmD [Candidatus Hydrogenedentes bacterium]|nr:23S rRNA (uracil(1939)-C(5))-methyltransferase RlmD [Candidatus Hydrogenedentota bacterium]